MGLYLYLRLQIHAAKTLATMSANYMCIGIIRLAHMEGYYLLHQVTKVLLIIGTHINVLLWEIVPQHFKISFVYIFVKLADEAFW